MGCQGKKERKEDGTKVSPILAFLLRKKDVTPQYNSFFERSVCDCRYIEPEAAVFNTSPRGK